MAYEPQAQSVVSLNDYREKSTNEPCVVTFIGFEFEHSNGDTMRLIHRVTVDDGDFEAVINRARENGGAYLPSHDGSDYFWFLPWPPSAIHIEPIRSQTAEETP